MKKSGIIRSAIALLTAVSLCGCNNRLEIEVNSGGSSGGESSAELSSKVGATSGSSGNSMPEVIPPGELEPAYVAWMREEKVHEIRIEMDPEDWKKILSDPFAGEYYSADVSIDGSTVENVGVRARGHGSLAAAMWDFPGSNKYPLKIKFDKYDKDQTFMGLDELALNNGGYDYSLMRDYMGYEAFRLLGGDASCVTFFNVYINEELRGFYVGVECIDTSYLERLFDSHKNNLYEGEEGASLTPYMSLSCLVQKKGKDESKEDVKRLIQVLSETPLGEKGEIETILDVDSVLRVLAVNAVLDNRDGYGGIRAHNYYFYNNNGKLVMLPWDMNGQIISAWTDVESPTIGTGGYSLMNYRPLAKKLMAVEEYYAGYLEYCKQLTEKLPELKETIIRLHGIVKESVENDTHKFCSSNYYNGYFSENKSYGMVYFLTKRYSYLTERIKQLEGKPVSSSVLNPPPLPPPPVSSSVKPEPEPEPSEGEPEPSSGDPVSSSGEPVSSSGEPVPSGGDPVSSSGEPVSSSGEPVSSGGEPVSSGGEPVSSGGAPVSSGGAPASSGGEPVTSSGDPVPSEGET